jgi:hypothetical protein
LGLIQASRLFLLVNMDQLASIEAEPFSRGDKALQDFCVKLSTSGQNPQVLSAGTANQGIVVVFVVKFDHVVAAVKGPEKSDFEA